MENVDDQKRQLITQFMELCDVNYDEAHLHLDQFQWDLESALEGFFLSQFEDRENPATINSTASTATQSTEDAHDPTHNTQNMSISNSVSWVTFLKNLCYIPFSLAWHTVKDLLYHFYGLFFPWRLSAEEEFNELYRRILGDHSVASALRFTADPLEQVLRRADSTDSLTFIIIVDNSETSIKFLQEFVNTVEFMDLVAMSNPVLYGNVRNGKNNVYKFLTEEGITKFPYFAFARIDQYSNLRLTPIPIALNNRTLLFGAMENFVREDVRQVEERRLARIQAEQDSLLMQRQNEEYAESLRIDQIKQQQKISEEFERKKELKKKQDEEDKRTALIEAVKARYANIPKHVSEIQGSIKYRVQFPNGDRIVLAVNEEDPAENVFTQIACQPACPTLFSVARPHPRETLPIFPQWFTRIVEEYATLSHFEIEVPPSGHNLSVKAAGISSGEAFFVADLV